MRSFLYIKNDRILMQSCSVGMTNQHAWIQSPKCMTHNMGSNPPISFFSLSLCMSSSQPRSFFPIYTHDLTYFVNVQSKSKVLGHLHECLTCNPYFNLCDHLLSKFTALLPALVTLPLQSSRLAHSPLWCSGSCHSCQH